VGTLDIAIRFNGHKIQSLEYRDFGNTITGWSGAVATISYAVQETVDSLQVGLTPTSRLRCRLDFELLYNELDKRPITIRGCFEAAVDNVRRGSGPHFVPQGLPIVDAIFDGFEYFCWSGRKRGWGKTIERVSEQVLPAVGVENYDRNT